MSWEVLGPEAAGVKYKFLREVDTDRWQDLLSLSAADAAKLTNVHAWGGLDEINNQNVVVYMANYVGSGAIDLTDYGAMDIGSIIIDTTAATKCLYVKIAKSATAVVGDWYYVNLTQVT
jgi:hypothetical protein